MNKLRVLLFETPRNYYYNLAFKEAFYSIYDKIGGDPTLRIWRRSNAVVIGYFQIVDEEVSEKFARKFSS